MKKRRQSLVSILRVAAVSMVLLSSGCTQDIENDIDDLRKRVEILEDLVGDLSQKIEEGALVKSVTELEHPEKGWLIEFTGDGDPIKILHGNHGETPMVEVRTNDDGTISIWVDGEDSEIHLRGSDGISPKIEVRPNTGGAGLSIWYNITPGYPEDGWVNTGVNIQAPPESNPLLAITKNETNGTVTFTLNDGKRTEYTFSLWSTAQNFQIMVKDDIEFSTSAEATFVFRVNPSGAWIPTGSGDAIAKWALDEFETRSYVNPSELFTIASVLPQAGKKGEYVARISFDATEYEGDISEFDVALVLDNNTGTATDDNSLISSSLFTLSIPEGAMFVSTRHLGFEFGGGDQTVRVVSKGAWNATSTDSWITVNSGNDSFTVTTVESSEILARTGYVTIDNGTQIQTVEVRQKSEYLEYDDFGERSMGYNWDDYGNGTGAWSIELYDMLGLNALYFEALSPYFDDRFLVDLPEGTYRWVEDEDSGAEFTFFYAEAVVDDEWYEVTGGSFTVTHEKLREDDILGRAKIYTMVFNLELDNGEILKAVHKKEGRTAQYYPLWQDLHTDFNDYTVIDADAEYWSFDYGLWHIIVEARGAAGEEPIIDLYVNAEEDLEYMPVGYFPMAAKARQSVAGTAEPYHEYEDTWVEIGTVLLHDGLFGSRISYAMPGHGFVDIKRTNQTEYTLTWEFLTPHGYKRTGTYTGVIEGADVGEEEVTGFQFNQNEAYLTYWKAGNFDFILNGREDGVDYQINAGVKATPASLTDLQLPEGTYTMSNSGERTFAYIDLINMDEYDTLYAESGSFTVARAGDDYIVDFNIEYENGYILDATYRGPIDISNTVGAPRPANTREAMKAPRTKVAATPRSSGQVRQDGFVYRSQW